jgi:IMP dehydrogenase/GMP reductase
MKFDKISQVKLDFNDLVIQPASSSDVDSRIEINPYDEQNMLPLFVAPMDTVVSPLNMNLFLKSKINVCMPRGNRPMQNSNGTIFTSYSLNEFEENFLNRDVHPPKYILIDIANGHMKKLEAAIIKFKKRYPNVFVMAGNVANSDTYRRLSLAGADAVRIGIGNGNGCLTTEQTGIGYPMASLIRECHYSSISMENPARIIADGGMKSYSDAIKAIALGADYVMIGSIFNKTLESSGPTYFLKYFEIDPLGPFANWAYRKGFTLTKKFRGMSTKEAQKSLGNITLKTSEGVIRYRPVEYTISKWSENFESYLRSAMSYTNCKTLEEFRGKVEINVISENAFRRFNK